MGCNATRMLMLHNFALCNFPHQWAVMPRENENLMSYENNKIIYKIYMCCIVTLKYFKKNISCFFRQKVYLIRIYMKFSTNYLL